MPMQWNAEADAKLMSAIMQICDVKLSEANCEALGQIMGVTAKAIRHRLGKFRQAAKDYNITTTTTASAAPKQRAKTTTTKASKKGRAASPAMKDEDDVDADATLTSSSPTLITGKAKCGSKRRAQATGRGGKEDGGGLNKRVKIEVGEDLGEGLRKTNPNTASLEDEEEERVEAEEGEGGDSFT